MYKITVLVSTYNGEKYIKEQIDSILSQEDVEVDILVRDDGSTDKTQDILKKYCEKHHNIKYYTGDNLRTAKSFMDLVFSCEKNDYYAFCDQDDFWLPRKLVSAIKKLEEGYSLYCCKKEIVNSKLEKLNVEDVKVRGLDLGYTILKSDVSGCTMVFRNELMDMLRKYKPVEISMHDAWALKVASCIGKVFYDENKYILYRQHDKNVVGCDKTEFNKWKHRLKTFKNRKNDLVRINMAKQLYNNYGQYLDDYTKKNLYYFANSRKSFKSRIKIIFSKFLKTQNSKEVIFVKILILIGLV